MPNSLSPTAYWQSPLHEQLLAWQPDSKSANAQITVSELPRLGYITLRGQIDDAVFVNSTQAILGLDLPNQAMKTAQSAHIIALWLSPDEWLLVTAYATKEDLIRDLTVALAGQFAQVVDNSGGFTSLYLSGKSHVQVLRHLSPFDVDGLAMGQCAATVMSKAGTILVRSDAAGMVLICRRSFADYVWRLIQKATRPYGLALSLKPESHVTGIWRDLF